MREAAEKLKALAKRLTTATTTIVDEIAKARREIAEKRAERDRMLDAPIPLVEIEGRIADYVRDVGADWLQSFGSSLIGGERTLGSYGLVGSPSLPWNFSAGPPWGAICASDPTRAAAMLKSLVARVEYSPGPASVDRPGLIARLEAELHELELLEENLIDDAAAGGVDVAHRPEVLQRRDREAREKHHMERAAEDRRQRQDALDRVHDRRQERVVIVGKDGVEHPVQRGRFSQYLHTVRSGSGKQIVP